MNMYVCIRKLNTKVMLLNPPVQPVTEYQQQRPPKTHNDYQLSEHTGLLS